MDTKNVEKEIKDTILAIAKEPKNVENYHTLANLYAIDSKFDNMISTYETLLQIKPDDVLALINIGSLWSYKKDYRKSFAYYKSFICFKKCINIQIAIG